jgi:hypothetical protein
MPGPPGLKHVLQDLAHSKVVAQVPVLTVVVVASAGRAGCDHAFTCFFSGGSASGLGRRVPIAG